MNVDYSKIADDVKLEINVINHDIVNLYSCEVGGTT